MIQARQKMKHGKLMRESWSYKSLFILCVLWPGYIFPWQRVSKKLYQFWSLLHYILVYRILTQAICHPNNHKNSHFMSCFSGIHQLLHFIRKPKGRGGRGEGRPHHSNSLLEREERKHEFSPSLEAASLLPPPCFAPHWCSATQSPVLTKETRIWIMK